MIYWETFLNKFTNLPESLASLSHEKFKDLFKSTEGACNDIIEMSKILDKEMEELENRLTQ
jgi:hypothetical protein